LKKEDFKIELDKNIMTISVEKKEAKAEKFIRQEYKYNAFKRSFTLEENIDVEQIAAQYVNGVLRLNLPKKAMSKQQQNRSRSSNGTI
jgi:HSP20 family protein